MTDDLADNEVFDHSGFVHRMMGDKELAAEILSEFFVDISEQIQVLKNEGPTAEFSILVRLAHTVKGASANVGAKQMQKSALLAEQAAAREDREAFTAVVPQIEAEFAQLKQVVSKLRDFPVNFEMRN